MTDRYLYMYRGPIMSFGRCVCAEWFGETVASTGSEATRNLTYQAKKYLGLTVHSSVNLANDPKKLAKVRK